MAFVQFHPQQRNDDVWYPPSPTSRSFDYSTIQHFHMQDTVHYLLTLPTPLVSIPPAQPGRQKTLVKAIYEARPVLVEEEACVTKSTDEGTWSISAKWWTPNDVKWTGYVEYPESSERSSIAREAEHQNTSTLRNEQGNMKSR